MSIKSDPNAPLNLELLLQDMPDLYLILNPEFKIAAVSNSYAQATNIIPEEVLGENIFKVFPDNEPNKEANSTLNLRNSLERVLLTKAEDSMAVQRYDIPIPNSPTNEFEFRYWSPVNIPILGKNHEVLYIIHRVEDVSAFIQAQGPQNTSDDKTRKIEIEIFRRAQEIQETNKRLRESEERLRLFIDNSKDYAFLMLDADGYINTWNKGAERIKGYKAHEIVGKHFSIFYTQEDIDNHHPQEVLRLARELGRYEEQGWRVTKSGNAFWANILITPIYDETARIIGFGKVTRDLTETRKAEKLKNEFVSVVSHELRTPLTSIRGALGLILGGAAGETTDKIKQLLKIANTNCERLTRLINDILDIEKIEAGKMVFKFKRFDLAKLVNDAATVNQMYGEKFGVTIECSLLKDVYVNVDNDRLMQALTNLISNAVKFSNKDGVVTIKMTDLGTKVEVAVSDKGQGIPEDFKEKIFQKFSQADSSTTRSESGTGLGLAISKAIIERLNGSLGFTSELNKGTTFYFTLPKLNPTKIKLTSQSDHPAQRVLVCEDDDEQADYIAAMIQSAGYDSEICHTAEDVKQLLEEKDYYALVLDLILPDKDGIEVIKELRNAKRNQEIPIIVVSVIAKDTKELVNGNMFQVIDWLDKPIDFNKLSKAFSTINDRVTGFPNLLHIEDDIDTQNIVKNLLEDRATITSLQTIKDAKKMLGEKTFDLAILDLILPDGNGIELLPLLAESKIPVIVFARGDLDTNFSNQVQQVLVKSQTSTNKLLTTLSGFLNNRIS
jgi:PAS domain S-box-containing protein